MDESKRKTKWVYVVGLLVIGFLGTEDLVLIVQNQRLKEALAPPQLVLLKPGEVMSSFRVRTRDGQFSRITYSDSVDRYILFVLSTKCPHCHNTLGQWNAIAGMTGMRRCRVLGVSTSDFDETAQYDDTSNIKFDLVTLADSSFFRKYKVFAYPETIVLSGSGKVDGVWAGELSDKQLKEIETQIGSGVQAKE